MVHVIGPCHGKDHLSIAEKLVVCKPSMGRIVLANGKH